MDSVYSLLWICSLIGLSLAEYCTTSDYSRVQYCSSGCCGSYSNRYCCSAALAVWIIVLVVIGCIIFVSVIIAVVCCCVKRQGQQGVVVSHQQQIQTTTVGTAQYPGQGVVYPQVVATTYPSPYQTNLSGNVYQQQAGYQPNAQAAYPPTAGYQQTNQAYLPPGYEKENVANAPPPYQE